MQKSLIAAAFALAGATATPVLALELDGRPFVGFTWGESSANYHTSARAQAAMPDVRIDHVIRNSDTWGVRAGHDMDAGRVYVSYGYVSDSYHSTYRLRQETLSLSYDHYLPLGDFTRLFGGASVGANYISQNSSGYTNDRNWGAHAGLQAGLLQELGDGVQLELGYRYLRPNNGSSVDFRDRATGLDTGSVRLKSVEQAYLGLNWRF